MKRGSGAKFIGRRSLLTAVATSLLGTATGCSLFAPWHETLVIDSEPQGAAIVIPGYERMTTPASVSVPCDKDLTVVIRKEGYHTQVQTVRRTLGKCGVLDVVGTVVFLLPAVGLFSPGAYSLEPHTVFSVLPKIREEAAAPAPAPAPAD